MTARQTAGQSYNIKIDNKSVERVEQFIYLGTALANQNLIQEKNYEQIEVRECLLSFGAESFVLQFGVQKYKN